MGICSRDKRGCNEDLYGTYMRSHIGNRMIHNGNVTNYLIYNVNTESMSVYIYIMGYNGNIPIVGEYPNY